MGLDVAVLDDQYRYKKHFHIDKMLHGVLFRKMVTPGEYPSLGKAQDDSEDITFKTEDVPALLADIVKLEKHLKREKRMAKEVKARCLEFVSGLKEICETAVSENKNVEFIAGE